MVNHRFAKRIGIVVSLSAAALAIGVSPASAVDDDDVYQLPPPPPTLVIQPPPVPPPEVQLPGTGTSSLQTSLTLGVSAAAIGGGLLLVARRRREPLVAVG